MLKHMLLFVLVMIMVKTNAQTSHAEMLGKESNDRMVIKITRAARAEEVHSLLEMIREDRDFATGSTGAAGYFVLTREPGSTVSREEALAKYMAIPYVAYASFAFENPDNSFVSVANDVFVKAKTGVSIEEIKTTAEKHGLIEIVNFRPERNIYQLFLDKKGNTIDRTLQLYNSGLFEFAEPNFMTTRIRLDAYGNKSNSTPNCSCVTYPQTIDPYMTAFKQWGLYTGSSTQYSGAYWVPTPSTPVVPYSDINVCHAWELNNGSAVNQTVDGTGINIAIVDDGVDTRHPDLSMRMNGTNVYGYDAANNPLTGSPPVYYRGAPIYNTTTDPGCPDGPCGPVYHGTAVAGVAAAKRNNTISFSAYGMAGVAHNAKIMPVHAFWDTAPCAFMTTDYQVLADGIHWAVTNGADVINCSWSNPPYPPGHFGATKTGSKIIQDEIDYAVDYGRNGKGCVMVFTTGNTNYYQIAWPACNPRVIAVGASNMCNQRKQAGYFPSSGTVYSGTVSCDNVTSWGSNFGYGAPYVDFTTGLPLNTSGRISVVAPGTSIASTTHPDVYNPASFYDNLEGTSLAAPYVTGVAALILSVNNCLRWDEVKAIIEASADQVNPAGSAIYDYTTNNGWNEEMGFGRVNAGNAVTLAYDMYRQHQTETSTKVYKSSHHIFAGSNVTDIYKYYAPGSDKYVVGSSARINFYAPDGNAIHLEPGFETNPNAYFLADIVPDYCDKNNQHYKLTQENNRTAPLQDISSGNLISDIAVYPNPVKELLNVSLTLTMDSKVELSIMSITGQRIGNIVSMDQLAGKQVHSISTASLIPGIYLIDINTTTEHRQLKFVKQ